MNTIKNIPRMMGGFYIIGTVSGILSRVISGRILDDQDLLFSVSVNGNQITMGALMVMIMGSVLTLIPVVAYPIFKKHNEILALGYVVFRGALEGVAYMGIVVSWLLLLPLSRIYHQAGTPKAASIQALGKVLLESSELGVVLMIAFGLGGLMLYGLLFQTKLVPRWLSAWGLIAILMNIAAGLSAMFGVFSPTSEISTLLQLPIFIQEMVFAIWLIVKGFNKAPIPTA